MATDERSEQIAVRLLDVLRREENAILEGHWRKLAPLDRLRTKFWNLLGATPALHLSPSLAEALRQQSDANTRLLTQALMEVGEKLVGARRRQQVRAAYGQP